MTQMLDSIGELIRSGRLNEARKGLEAATPNDENRNELTFLRGYLHEMNHEREEAAAVYEKLLEKEANHTEAAFRLALLADLAGDEERAIELYEKCISERPAHTNALINLSVLYEENGLLREAQDCLESVLSAHPNHFRARQFLKSVESSYSMNYDDRSPHREFHGAIMDVPITDFELSVRSRNCLRQMQIRTVGDLLRISEPELLAYKNFGETSLNEIKAILAQRGLRLGQAVPSPERHAAVPSAHPAGESAVPSVLNKPVSELELSVRSRKCLQWLGVNTIGDLAMRSEAELLAIKNFGQTSMQELKRQLAQYGLSLR